MANSIGKYSPYGITIALVLMFASGAIASELVFQGQNAAVFPGANPSDTVLLMNSVPKPTVTAPSPAGITPATLIEQSVEAQISAQINNAIFNSTSASGSFNLGGGNIISYTRAGGYINITITDPSSGTNTFQLPDTSR